MAKQPSSQAMGRAKAARDERYKKRREMEEQFAVSGFRGTHGADGNKGTIPATYGQDNMQKKLKPIQRLQNKMTANYKNPVNALAMNRSAKAKDSTAMSKKVK